MFNMYKHAFVGLANAAVKQDFIENILTTVQVVLMNVEILSFYDYFNQNMSIDSPLIYYRHWTILWYIRLNYSVGPAKPCWSLLTIWKYYDRDSNNC